MSGWWLLLLGLLALLLTLAWGLRRQVCLRRADCCGKGCGCLFPAIRPRRIQRRDGCR